MTYNQIKDNLYNPNEDIYPLLEEMDERYYKGHSKKELYSRREVEGLLNGIFVQLNTIDLNKSISQLHQKTNEQIKDFIEHQAYLITQKYPESRVRYEYDGYFNDCHVIGISPTYAYEDYFSDIIEDFIDRFSSCGVLILDEDKENLVEIETPIFIKYGSDYEHI